jgi:hypothetical protein
MRQLSWDSLAEGDHLETPAVTLVRFPVYAEEPLATADLYAYTGGSWL